MDKPERERVTAHYVGTPRVQLELSRAAAEILCGICGSIGGNQTPEIREHTDAIYDALSRIGVACDQRVLDVVVKTV